ncbi:epoxide hydrolase N-terminal domain-containing protein [Streptomyces sp. NPDC096013]|uniref:epoxide hydrolase N-terminal domain-containing protein n=1 Tax=Streptomyces sp. NPDC096013 TaxID=3366069 RepID=UPI0038237599
MGRHRRRNRRRHARNPDLTDVPRRRAGNGGRGLGPCGPALSPFRARSPARVHSPSTSPPDVDDLPERLHRTRWFESDLHWSAVVPIRNRRGLVTYWTEKFDGRAAERHLNELSRFQNLTATLAGHGAGGAAFTRPVW